mgnify:CR=1 FL=1
MTNESPVDPERLSRDQLVALVRGIMNAEGTEQEIRHWVRAFEANVPHPASSALVFWPDHVPGFKNPAPTAEEIVDFALQYQPRILPRERLVTLVQAYMHPRNIDDNDNEAFYLIAENLPGFEINHLTDWGRRRGLTAAELVEQALNGAILADPGFQRELADDSATNCG